MDHGRRFDERWGVTLIKYGLGPLLFAAVTWGAVRTELSDLKIQADAISQKEEDHESRISKIEGKIDQVIDLQKEVLRRLK